MQPSQALSVLSFNAVVSFSQSVSLFRSCGAFFWYVGGFDVKGMVGLAGGGGGTVRMF